MASLLIRWPSGVAQSLQSNSPWAALHIGALTAIHRFGSSLNGHVYFHVRAVDWVFEEVPGDVIFYSASAIDETTVALVQATLRNRILRDFVDRGLLQSGDAKEMLGYQHSGFSVVAGGIEAHARAALLRSAYPADR